jgi:transcriptional regulator with XRE-family HTH domain
MTDVRTLLARNIKRCRGAMDLSQEQFAERVGISPSMVGKIENCTRFPSPENLDGIAAALKIHPSDLFAEESTAIKALQSKYEVREKLDGKIKDALDEALDEEP